ncbi:hypothetical protein FJQ98_16485 [Lysinibacillus agricola]|uniref:DpnD/PcfM-like protein n=1 Tax=Lysinibacillus agricola TaxID=2590012 RepID=A0ABX7ALR2_9BACI|nr:MULTISPECIES: hypothetical protein [Lysinibacillus]QQP10843.1 hypothetical protein FJQ98_16485 [Lysinibacillus agricola]
MKFEVQYEQKSTRIMIVEADSLEEAEKKAFDGEYEDDWEEDSSEFRILDIKESENQ